MSAGYIRNFIFGVEDSLVSTVGLLSGIAVAGISGSTILLTGVVLIFVEAFSMAAGSFLSERSADEYVRQGDAPGHKSAVSAVIMFLSYFISGFIPLAPYLVLPVNVALKISIFLSLAFLFLLGAAGAKISQVSIWQRGLRMLVIGGSAIGVGIIAAQISRVL